MTFLLAFFMLWASIDFFFYYYYFIYLYFFTLWASIGYVYLSTHFDSIIEYMLVITRGSFMSRPSALFANR